VYIYVGFLGDEVQRFQDRLKDLLAGEADQRTFCDLLNDQLFQYEYYFTIRHLLCICRYWYQLQSICCFYCTAESAAVFQSSWQHLSTNDCREDEVEHYQICSVHSYGQFLQSNGGLMVKFTCMFSLIGWSLYASTVRAKDCNIT